MEVGGYGMGKDIGRIRDFMLAQMRDSAHDAQHVLRVTRAALAIARAYPQADVEQLSNMQSGSMDADVRLSLWDAVMTLDVSYRTVILLFYYEDMSIRQIAKTLTLSEDTVKKRLSRAREKLRTSLEKEDFE